MLAEQSVRVLPPEMRKPKRHFNIVVAGEFNSGKSSVLNLLLRKEVVPVSVGVSGLPPAQVVHSDVETYDLSSARSGQKLTKSDLFNGASGEKFGSINIAVPMEEFRGAAIFEVSVGQDGELDQTGQKVLSEADLLIWCTMGQRAWCLSEISIVEVLPKSLLDTAILAVTRSDYLRNTEDIGKVERRLKREASEFFDTIVMLDGSRKSISKIADRTVWKRSGGQELFDQVSSKFKKPESFEKVRLVASNDAPEIKLEAQPNPTLSHAEMHSAWAGELDEIENWIAAQAAPAEREIAEQVKKRLIEFSNIIQPADIQWETGTDYFEVFKDAARYLSGALSNPEQSEIGIVAVDLSLQLLRELDPSFSGNHTKVA